MTTAACLLALTLSIAGCAALTAPLRTSAALEGAGYQNVGVNLGFGSGSPAGGLITVSYSRGPAGNDQSDAQHAEKIVWDSFPGRFGALEIVKVSGGCTGPLCATNSDVLAGATYAQLAATFGPRPNGLGKPTASGLTGIPPWAVVLIIGLAVAVLAGGVILLRSIMRRNKSRPPGPPPGAPVWQPGPPPGPPPWQPGPPPR